MLGRAAFSSALPSCGTAAFRRALHGAPRAGPKAGAGDARTYREELYASRRVDLREGTPVHVGLRRLFSAMNGEGVIATIRSKREFTRPGLVKSLAKMRARQQRFDTMVRSTIAEIKDIYRRLQ